MLVQSVPAQSLSANDINGKIFRTIGMIVVLEFLGLIVAVLMAALMSSAFGQELSHYPWNVVLFVDLAFILFAASLAEYAGSSSADKGSPISRSQSWALASFLIAVGTLAPVATHAAKAGRDVFERAAVKLEEPTILSEILCAQYAEGCTRRYFFTAACLTLLTCFVAAFSARTLRKTAVAKEDHGSRRHKAQGTFAASVFLFGTYTLLAQKWDVAGASIAPISSLKLVGVVVLMLALMTVLVLIGSKMVRRTADTVRLYRSYGSDLAQQHPRREIRTTVVPFLVGVPPMAVWVALLATLLFIISRVDSTNEHADPEIFGQAVSLLKTFIYLSLALIACVAAIVVVFTSVALLRYAGRYLRGALARAWQKLKHGLLMLVARFLARREEPKPEEEAPVEEASERRRLPKIFPQSLPLADILSWSGWMAARVLALCAVAYGAYFFLGPFGPQPYGGAGGKGGASPVGASLGKGTLPPLKLTRASVSCSVDEPLTWAYSEVDAVRASSNSCRFSESAPIACGSAAIVVAGTASAAGTADSEVRRARDRGARLASVLQADFRRRCGDNGRLQSYVLNLGRYLQDPRGADDVGQREVIVLIGAGERDSGAAFLASQEYANGEATFARYSNCDFYSVADNGTVTSLGGLNCPRRRE